MEGTVGLDVMTSNNPDTYTKKQGDGYEYYYGSDESYEYYFWLQDGDFLKLDVPKGIDVSLGDIIENIECMRIN